MFTLNSRLATLIDTLNTLATECDAAKRGNFAIPLRTCAESLANRVKAQATRDAISEAKREAKAAETAPSPDVAAIVAAVLAAMGQTAPVPAAIVTAAPKSAIVKRNPRDAARSLRS